MGSSKRKKNESFFKSASAPAFLRYYSIFNMIKISGIVTFLYFMAFNQKNVILNAYPNFSACSKCLSAAVAGQQTSNWYEFGYCDQTFFAPGSSSTGTPKAAQTSFNSVKDVNLLLNRGNMVWKRSLVLQYPIIVYSIVGLAGLAVLSLLYYTSAYGKLRLQDQGPLVALNIFVCSLLSVLMMWFFNTMYGYNKLNNCYVTSFNPTMSMISFIAADALIFLGSVWFLTAHTRFKKMNNILVLLTSLLFVTFNIFEIYLAYQTYSNNQTNFIPLAVCGFLFVSIFELPMVFLCCHKKEKEKEEGNKPLVDDNL